MSQAQWSVHSPDGRLTFELTGAGDTAHLAMRASDGIAFRYRREAGGEPLSDELTEFPPGARKAWIQPHHAAGIHTPAYEACYGDGVAIGTQADGASWNLPARFNTWDHRLLIAEADLLRAVDV
jgi:hypothetical protein